MSEPITGPSYNEPLQPSGPAPSNVPLLSKQMQDSVSGLASQLQKVLDDPSLAAQESFLRDFAANGQALNQKIEQANGLRG